MIVEVVPLPSLLLEAERKVAIVVDALRASNTVTAIFAAGAARVMLAADRSEALRIASPNRSRLVLCGESGGVRLPDFDFGNSPTELARADLAGRDVVFCTSNGTRALLAVAGARAAFVGGGRNGPTVAKAALEDALASGSDLAIVCAGDDRGTVFSLEDFYFAGYLVELTARMRPFVWPVDEADPRPGDPNHWVLDESALAARRLYRSYLDDGRSAERPRTDEVRRAFEEARNGHSLPRIGYAGDLDYCAEVDRSTVVPRLTVQNGRLVLVDPS